MLIEVSVDAKLRSGYKRVSTSVYLRSSYFEDFNNITMIYSNKPQVNKLVFNISPSDCICRIYNKGIYYKFFILYVL